MPNSIHKDKQGPDWPLGNIVVVAPGTPVSIMSLVDPNSLNASGSASPTASANNTGAPAGGNEFTERCQQIIFQAYKSAGANGLNTNTGNIYIVRKGVGAGTGNRADLGSIVAVLQSGQTFSVGSSALVKDVFSPYRYFIDADNVNDGCQVTLFIF